MVKRNKIRALLVTLVFLLQMLAVAGIGLAEDGQVAVTYLEITPNSISLEEGASQAFIATAYFSDGSSQDVTSECDWYSSDVGIINGSNGSFTALSAGEAVVVADYEQVVTGLEEYAYADVSVYKKQIPVGRTTFRVTPGSSTVQVGSAVQFSAILTREGVQNPNTDVTNDCSWYLDRSIATMSANGYYVGSSPGTTTVHASYYDAVTGQTYTYDVELTVVGPKPPAGYLVVRPSSQTGYPGDSESYRALLRLDDGSEQDVTRYCDWSIRNSSIASNQGNGVFKCVKAGNTTVTAEYVYQGSTLHDTADLKVYNTGTLYVEPGSASIYTGESTNFTARLSYKDGSADKDVTSSCNWSVDSSAASVSGKGTIKGMAKGSATVYATYTASDGTVSTAHAVLTVSEESPQPQPVVSAMFTLGSTSYTVNGITKVMEVTPYASNDRVFVPQRYLAYAIGLADSSIVWDGASQSATFVGNNGITVIMQLGSVQYYINGIAHQMDVPPQIQNERVFCPARYVVEAFGYSVAWDNEKQAVIISR